MNSIGTPNHDPSARSARADGVDQAIRTMLATAIAEAPRPPAIDHLDDLALRRLDSVSRTSRSRRPMLALTGLATAAALIGGAVFIAGRDGGESQDRSAVAANVNQDEVVGLPAHVLPTFVPDGWVLADIAEQVYFPPAESGYSSSDTVPSQLFRRASDGAAVRLEFSDDRQPGSAADPDVPVSAAEVVEPPDTEAAAVPDAQPSVTDAPGVGPDAAPDAGLTPPNVNRAPIAVEDRVMVASGESVTIDVLPNDADSNGDELVLAAVGAPGVGTVVINEDGTLTISSPPGFIGTTSFTYTISDGTLTSTSTVTIEYVDAADLAPASVEVQVLGNDSDPDGDTLEVVTSPVPSPEAQQVPLASGAPQVDEFPSASDAALREFNELVDQLGLSASDQSGVIVSSSAGQFEVSGEMVTIETVGIDDGEAQAFVRSLQIDTARGFPRFIAPPDSGFSIEVEQLGGPPPSGGFASGRVSYLVGDTRGWSFGVQPAESHTMSRMGVPTVVDGVTLYVGSSMAYREPLDGVVVSAPYFGEDKSTVLKVLASMETVDRTVWTDRADELAARYLSAPSVAELLVGDVTISRHQAGPLWPVCAADGERQRCHALVGVDATPDWMIPDYWGSFDVGDGWVAAGAWTDASRPINSVEVNIDGTSRSGGPTRDSASWIDAGGVVLWASKLPNNAIAGTYAVTGPDYGGGGGDLAVPII
jgi:hypothetical protein